MKTDVSRIVSSRAVRRVAFASAVALAVAAACSAGAGQIAKLTIQPEKGDRVGVYQLTWDSVPGALYRVQRSTDLGNNQNWLFGDAVIADGTNAHVQIQGGSSNEFFRLVLPQPEIFSVEPAVLAPGVAVNVYVVGQCFGSNDVLRINGVPQTNVVFQSATLLSRPSFTPDVAGTYLFELVVAGQVQSSFNVTCADAFTNPELVLQGPPDEPLASPVALIKTKTKSNQSNDRVIKTKTKSNQSNDRFAGGGGIREEIRENDNVTFDVQDGKKGLNAVNVKLARTAGGRGGGGESDFDCGGPAMTSRAVGKRALWGLGGNLNLLVAGGGDCDDGDLGVHPWSGEARLQVVDLAIEGRGLDFIWARAYNSRIGRTGASANGWTFSYDVRCVQNSSGGVDVLDGTGRKDTFKLQTNGVYTCPEFFREGTLTGSVFRLTFADTGYWEFNPLVGSATDGKLSKIVDGNANTMSLNYDGSGRLTQIVDDLDRTNTVAHDLVGRVVGVTDFSGRVVRYEYDGNGDLVACVSPAVTGTPNGNDFPGGKTNRYTYSSGYLDDRENHLLLSIIDANGQTVRTHVYQHNQTDFDFLRCISVQRWTNTPTMLTYLPQTPTPSNQFATLRYIVNGPVGDVTQCFYDARNRWVKLQEFTGRATPGVPVTAPVNQPAGKVRPSDQDFYETRWTWNNDSLCTAEISPGGQQLQCVYESDFDKSTHARKRADCRVVRELASSPVDLDGDGVADVTERVWHYDYDPRFGSEAAASRGIIASKPGSTGGSSAGRARGIIVNKPNTGGTTAGKAAALSAIGSIPFVGGILRGASDLSAPGARGIVLAKPGSTGGTTAAVTFGREKLKATTKTMGDFNLSNRSGDFVRGMDFDREFVTSATDPRGNVTTGTYDAKGNRVKVRFYWDRQSSADVDFAYDTYGQLTAITNAPDANGRRSVDTFTYSQGQVVQCVADAGAGGLALTENYEYDARGNLTRCIDPRTNDTLYTYNALDQLVQAQSAPLSNGGTGTFRIRTQFAYDANNNLTLVAEENLDAAGTPGTNPFWRTQFVYDGGQRLSGCWRDKNGALVLRCTEVKYNAADQVVRYRSPEAVNGNDPLNTVAYEYDERGLAYRIVSAPGSSVQSSSQWDYDANGNVTRVSEGLEGTPSITTMEYDGFAGFGDSSPEIQGAKYTMFLADGKPCRATCSLRMQGAAKGTQLKFYLTSSGLRVSKITDPMGNVTTFNYDANDNLKVARQFGQTNDVPGTNGNIRLAESRFEFDGLDRCVRSHELFFSPPSQSPIGDGERTTTFAYAPNGEVTGTSDDLGRVTTFAYDTACRLSSVSSPGARTVYARFYDAAGNVTRSTETDLSDLGGSSQVFAWTNAFDSLGRCTSTSDNVGNTASSAYDSRDNCTRMTHPNGNVTTYSYDGLSRTVNFTRTQSGTTTVVSSGQFAYDDNDRCIAVTDARGNSTTHIYDSLDRLTQTMQADGTHNLLVWSPRSNLIQETDANGTVIAHTYDANDRCVSNHITPGAGVADTTLNESFSFDGCSRLVAAVNDASSCTFSYDSLDNCVSEMRGGPATTSTYDSLGNRLSLTYPGGRALTYAYNVLNRCTNIMESGASLVSFNYDSPERLAKISYANGIRTRIFYDGISGTPNAAGDFGHGQVSRIRHSFAGASPVVSEVTLAWDRNGNKTSRKDAIFAPAIPRTNALTLTYDAADRLTRATVLNATTLLRDTVYGLDSMGNRTNVTGAAICSGGYTMSSTIPPSDSQMNQYTATPCDSRTYDEDGNLVSRSSAAGPVTYQYDYAGRLVLVQALDFNSGALAPVASYAYDALGRRISKTVYNGALPPVTTEFLYDGGSVIEERSGGVTTATFVRTRCYGAGQPSSQSCFIMRRSGREYYFDTDDQGNVLALTDSTGAVVERYNYDDFSAVTFLTSDGSPTSASSSAVGNPYCWHGLRLDAETGFQNDDGGGYLEPQTGRVITVPWIPSNPSIPHGTSAGNNPWSGGGGFPNAMKSGTVKFFNEAKGFGRVVGGFGDISSQDAFGDPDSDGR